MKQADIKTIIFDVGNVLIDFRWKDYLLDCGYDEETRERVGKATINNALWKEWDRGARSEEELIRLCCEQGPEVIPQIQKLFNDFPLLIAEYDYSAGLIRDLKTNGYRIYLLSNYSKRNFELGKIKFKFYPYVDGGVISYEIMHVKPEPEIYQALIDKYGFEPSEAVFLDDLQENLDGAKPFGFHTIQVKDYDQMLDALRELGVRI